MRVCFQLCFLIGFLLLHLGSITGEKAAKDANECISQEFEISPIQETLLTAAKQSPILINTGEKSKWLSMFAQDDISTGLPYVEDPVGGGRHRYLSGISSFYDIFISQNHIEFTELGDWVDAPRGKVYRDLIANVYGPMGGGQSQPCYMVYTLDVETLKVKSLVAYWSFLTGYPAYVPSGNIVYEYMMYPIFAANVFYKMGAQLGSKFIGGYVINFADTLMSGASNRAISFWKVAMLAEEFDHNSWFVSNATIQLPGKAPVITPNMFVSELVALHIHKIVGVKPTNSGYKHAAMRLKLDVLDSKTNQLTVKEGIAMFEFDEDVNKIISLSAYWNH